MGWGHPDTISMVGARGFADRTGHDHDSVEWLRAYRDAYVGQSGAPTESLDKYVKSLDDEIEKLEGKP